MLSLPVLYGFLLVLARVAGAFVFVPLPGGKHGPELVRVVMALAIASALVSRWPQITPADPGVARLAGWLLSEAALGMAIGLAAGLVTEAFVLSAQIVGLQAGYAYASTIDPTTQADSSVLLIFAQLGAGLLFFACGLDREVLRIFARSLETCPPASFSLTRPMAEAIVRLGAGMMAMGLRLAMPAIALLVLVDLTFALLGRIHAQMQLLSLAFPAKMLTAMALLAWMTVLFPRLYEGFAGSCLAVVRKALGL